MSGLRSAVLAALVALVALLAPGAHAAGFDLPVLFNARHAALGGAAVGYVDDPSALLHDPAGLAGVAAPTVLVAVSTFWTSLQTSPGRADQDLSTGRSLAPVPMFGVASPVSRRVVVGLAVHPSGAAGAEFHYRNGAGVPTIDRLGALLVEITPGVAVQVTPTLRLGLGWRVTWLRFDRESGAEENPTRVDLHLSGTDVLGLRVGLQWRPTPAWQVGLSYRHRVAVPATASSGMLLGAPAEAISTSLVIPAKLSAGARVDLGRLGLVADAELVFNAQQDSMQIDARLPSQGSSLSVPFLFRWDDSLVLKGGAEYRLRPDLALRAGYAFDGRATNRRYPSAFASPPTSSHYVTAGVGWELGRVRLGLALVHRFSRAVYIAQDEIAEVSECPFCGKQGTYAASASAAMIDLTASFGR